MGSDMFVPCEHKAYPYQFRISSKRPLNLITRHYCIYVKLEKIYQYSYIYLNLAQIHFPTLSPLKTFLDTTQSKESISIQLFKHWCKLFTCINRRKGSSKVHRDHGQHIVKFNVLCWLRLPQLQPE